MYEIDADDVGPSLLRATAKVAKVHRDRAPHPADRPEHHPPARSGAPASSAADPWMNGGGAPPF